MRFITSILLFLAGCGLIAYSYIGAAVLFADDVGKTADEGDPVSAFWMIIDLITGGTVPRLSGFLYGGALLIAVSIVTLIVRRKRHDR